MSVQLWGLQGFINPINNANLNQTESLGNTLQERADSHSSSIFQRTSVDLDDGQRFELIIVFFYSVLGIVKEIGKLWLQVM